MNFKYYSVDDRFSMFSKLIDSIDPKRKKVYFVADLLDRCSDLYDKHRVLYQFINLGYDDISSLSPYLMVRHFYQPMLGKFIFKCFKL